MANGRQTGFVLRCFQAVLFYALVAVLLAGCAAESPNPLAVEKLNGAPPKQERYSMELDCRGIVNGAFMPGGIVPTQPYTYPVNYTGDWKMVYSDSSHWYMATSAQVGARIDFVATMSRVVFDFWDYKLYDNPGRVKFLIDNKPLGSFNLARDGANGLELLNYQVATQKNTMATVTMILESGRVTVSGFLLNTLDDKYLY